MIRWLCRVALSIVGLSILLAIAGAAYQTVETRADAARSPESGRLVDSGGHRLNINCTGTGSPTVILEAGLGDLASEWKRVQPEIATFAHVCSYDRAGYGSSDAGPLPRTSAQIAEELHTLLRNAEVAPPFILVGHSFGGYSVRVYNGKYPTEVVGIVLVDATQEDQYELLPPRWKEIGAAQLKRYESQAKFAPLFIDLGIARVMLRARALRGAAQGLNETSYLILQSKYLRARASELAAIQISAGQARAAGDFRAKPLIVLTAGRNADEVLRNGLNERDFDRFQRIWVDDLQMRLARLSARAERIIVSDSGHDIPSERPDAIVSAVRKIRAALPVR